MTTRLNEGRVGTDIDLWPAKTPAFSTCTVGVLKL